MNETEPLDCDGYRKLLAAVETDEQRNPGFHNYQAKLAWAVNQAKHYAEKTGLAPEAFLDAWEQRRDYWYMNYYQAANFPTIDDAHVRVFETEGQLVESVGPTGFRCPSCQGISTSPYECNSGMRVSGKKNGEICNWKVYGLFGHMGRGIAVLVKDRLILNHIFMPLAWEKSKAAA